MRKIVLRKMGGSIGATIPKDLADLYRLNQGDEVFVLETEKGILLTPYDPNFERAMTLYEKGVKEYRNALDKLAR
ncbi:MAG TPA: AbrB/MazE/SpoVT family DNA-binding domain-containing protein [Firmicutes bacterium]|nr:AbrB/MazE/SpoVT family DNA-binding domain-containing protein [Bacillota bacterium]